METLPMPQIENIHFALKVDSAWCLVFWTLLASVFVNYDETLPLFISFDASSYGASWCCPVVSDRGTLHYPDLGSTFDWLNQISPAARPIRSTTQIWVVRFISMEFLHSFLRRHLAGKPVVASPNVGCVLRLCVFTSRKPPPPESDHLSNMPETNKQTNKFIHTYFIDLPHRSF